VRSPHNSPRRPQLLLAAVLACCGCQAPTTVLVRFSAPAGVTLDALDVELSLDGADGDTTQHYQPAGGLATGSVLVPLGSDRATAVAVHLSAQASAQAYSASGSVTSRPHEQVELDLDLTLAESPGPRFPRLGGISIANPQTYDALAFRQAAAKRHVVVVAYYPEWQGSSTMTMAAVMQDVKARSTIGTRMFIYVNNFDALNDPATPGTGIYPLWQKLNDETWWLYEAGTSGSLVRVPGFTSYAMCNTSTFAPADAQGKHWSEWNAEYQYQLSVVGDASHAANPTLDGFMIGNVTWRAMVAGDWNRDGVSDDPADPAIVDAVQAGAKLYLDHLRAIWPSGVQLVGMGGWGESDATLGVLDQAAQGGSPDELIGGPNAYETFGGFDAMMAAYRKVMAAAAPPKLVMFEHAGWTAGDYRGMRYGLGACLMDDGYYDINNGNQSLVSDALSFDEFDFDLGQAMQAPPTAAWSNGVWRRDFEHGIALVNPKGNGAQTVQLGGTFHRLSGSQDPATNDGSTVTSVTLADRDGLILSR
jgi:hypothetical protein